MLPNTLPSASVTHVPIEKRKDMDQKCVSNAATIHKHASKFSNTAEAPEEQAEDEDVQTELLIG